MCPQKLINVNGLSIGFDQMSFDWIDGLIDGAAGRLAAGATMQQCLAVHEIPLCQIYLPSPLSSHKASCFIYIFFTSFSCSFTSLIEILWSDLTLKQQSSWINLSAGTPVLLLSRTEYSEVALECLQSGKSVNFVA